MNRVIAIIPARYASTRFPGKPLALIHNKPMIQWVYEQTRKALKVDTVIVATDDERIYDAVHAFGGNAVMTPEDLPSGTDRVAFVAEMYPAEIVINVQGDEPLIDPGSVDQLAEMLLDNPDLPMATLVRRVESAQELNDSNKVRVVVDKDQNALYFSRAALPFVRDEEEKEKWLESAPFYEHVGMYGYRKKFLLDFTMLPASILEQAEKLEQLRALENGFTIKVGLTTFRSMGVDVPGDIQLVENRTSEWEHSE